MTPRQRLVLAMLILIAFSYVFATTLMAPLLLQIATEFGVSVGTAGLTTGAYAIPGVALTFLLGPYSDRYGRKRFLAVGTAVLGAGTLAAAVSPSFEVLVACRVVAGIGAAMSASSILATVGDNFPYQQRGRALGMIVGANALAASVGIPAAGLIAEATTWRVSVAIVGVLALAGAAVVAVWLPRSRGERTASTVRGLYGLVLGHRPALLLFAIAALSVAPWAMWNSYTVVFFQLTFGLPQGIASIFAIGGGIGILLGSQLGGRFGDRMGHRGILASTLMITALLVLIVTLVPMGIGIAALLVVGISAAAGARVVAQPSLLSEQVPEARGTLMAANSSVYSAATAIGAILGGVFIDASGFALLGVFCALSLLGAAALVLPLTEPRSHLREPLAS